MTAEGSEDLVLSVYSHRRSAPSRRSRSSLGDEAMAAGGKVETEKIEEQQHV